MQLRHLWVLLTIADEGTFVGAARRLRLAQPALSRQVAGLEAELGTPLFARGARGVRPTPAGVAALKVADELRKSLLRAIDETRAAEHGISGTCRICATRGAIWSGFMARLVALAARELPLVRLDLSEGEGREQWGALREGRADVGLTLVRPHGDAAIVSSAGPAWYLDAVLVARDHPLAERATVAVEDLRQYPAVILEWAVHSLESALRGSPLHEMLTGPAVTRVSSTEAGRVQLARGHAWHFFSTAFRDGVPEGLTLVPLSDARIAIPTWAMHRRGERDDVVLAVLQLVERLRGAPAPSDGAPRRRARHAGNGAEDPRAPALRALELRQLDYFQAIVQDGSMSGAAARLRLTQPALSRQVRSLEHALGVRLLARAARGATPTHAGQTLAEHYAVIRAHADRLGDEVRRVARGEARHCVLACASTPIVQRICTEVLRECMDADPPNAVALSEVPSPLLAATLLDARCDVAIGHRLLGDPDDEALLVRELLLEDAIEYALVPPTHPLAGRAEVRPSELGELPLLFIPRALSPPLYDRVTAAFAHVGYTPTIVSAGEGMHTRWALAREGLGWCLGFRSNLIASPPGLVPLRLIGFSVAFDLELITRGDESRPLVLEGTERIRRRAAVERAELTAAIESRATR